MNTYNFIIASLIIILIPGTGVIYTVSTGLTKSKKASILAALGCTIGIVPHLCMSIALSSLLFEMGELAFEILKMAGALYLVYLGIGMIRSKTKIEFNQQQSQDKVAAIIYRGVFINLLNPKLTLFFFSFLPQYISSSSQSYMQESLLLGGGFMLLTFVVFVCYGILAGLMSGIVSKSPKGLQRIQQLFGSVFIIFAIQLAISSL